jgi:hypothetical protein
MIMDAKLFVHSVCFRYPGSNAIELRDPFTDRPVPAPEWIDGQLTSPVAYVAGTRPVVRVVLGTDITAFQQVKLKIGVRASNGYISIQNVQTSFSDGRSGFIEFPLFPLPQNISILAVILDWFVIQNQEIPIGRTFHRFFTTWRAMQPRPEEDLGAWAYAPIVEWTCLWCQNANDEKRICDAIISNLPRSGLRYGVPGWEVRDILVNGGGMCGGFYKVFQHMAHCQGVFVSRRAFLVDWRTFAGGAQERVQWSALVCRKGGLNEVSPAEQASEFHDDNAIFPQTNPAFTAHSVVERRYRFWGAPGVARDGHCINFLEYRSALYLYDPSFATGPFQIDMPLPPNDLSILGGAALANFKSVYLDRAFDYMLGSLAAGITFYETNSAADPPTNGLTVKCAIIPQEMGKVDQITFYWA